MSATEAIFLLTVLGVAVALVLGSARRLYTVFCLAGWLAFSAALAASGWLAGFDARPPHFFVFMVPTALATFALAWSRIGASGRRGLLAWNCAGLALLANIVGIAVLSTPTPLRAFWNEPANTFVAGWPWIWLPGFLVPAALLGHLLSLRKIARVR